MTYVPYNSSQNLFTNGHTGLKGRSVSIVNLTSTPQWVLDRWFAYDSGNANLATYAVAATPLPTNAWSKQVASLTWKTGADDLVFGQRFPSSDAVTLKYRTVTVSFLARANTGTIAAPYVEVYYPTAVDNWTSITSASISQQTDVTIGNTAYVKCTATLQLNFSNISNGLQIHVRFPSGTMTNNQTVYLTQFVMNEGPVAAQFSLAMSHDSNENLVTGSIFESELGYKKTIFNASEFLSLQASTAGLKFLNSSDVEFFKYDDLFNDFTFGRATAGIYTFAATTAMTLPTGTTLQRPGSPVAGQLRYNTNTSRIETWTASISDYDNVASERFATAEAIKYSIVFG